MEDEPTRRVFTEAPTFSRSFVVSPGLTVADIRGEDDFEFIFTSLKLDPVVPTADEIFSDGQIRHMYPVFDQGLITKEEKSRLKLDLQALDFACCDLRSGSASSSSSMSTEADGAVDRELCFLSAKSAPQSPDQLWKRASTGSSGTRRRRIRDLVFGRSRSDGDEKLVTLPAKEHKVVGNRLFFRSSLDDASVVVASAEKELKGGKGKGKSGVVREIDNVKARRNYYGKGGQAASAENGNTRRSYLPYRQQILALGFFRFRSRFHLYSN